ncbi:unnamed protein product [Mytilus edulis]|uniref:Oxidoreductase-like domain-containing protein n=1 Tax=Mytilus edulis TaxID=6550 RepID=A0A8S3Q588_MYTED|nr:unnamed protein product [Mytilus edulis]
MSMYSLSKNIHSVLTQILRKRLLCCDINHIVYNIRNGCQLCKTVRHCSSQPNTQPKSSNQKISDDDKDIEPSLKTVLGDNVNSDKTCSTDVIPGKGRPPEPPVDCCMSGCANCVWIQYAEELKQYYSDGSKRALKEIDTIENESLKAFIKLELGLL